MKWTRILLIIIAKILICNSLAHGITKKFAKRFEKKDFESDAKLKIKKLNEDIENNKSYIKTLNVAINNTSGHITQKDKEPKIEERTNLEDKIILYKKNIESIENDIIRWKKQNGIWKDEDIKSKKALQDVVKSNAEEEESKKFVNTHSTKFKKSKKS